MSFLKKIFGKEDSPIRTYSDFWDWFQKNQSDFFSCVKNHENIEKGFFDILSPKLDHLHKGIYFFSGMCEENIAELVLTAEGNVKNFGFIEALVEAAPTLENWKFTPLKPAAKGDDFNLSLEGIEFNFESLKFFPISTPEYPDEIEITFCHPAYTTENADVIHRGVCLFLDTCLGELNFAETIDFLNVMNTKEATEDLVPIQKLESFLTYRQKEFIEKYEGIRGDTNNDNYTVFNGTLNNDLPLVAVMNTDLLNWDKKASHPWIMSINIAFEDEDNNGLPTIQTSGLMDKFEDDLQELLIDKEGFLNIGRETAANERKIYFACKGYRIASKTVDSSISKNETNLEISYSIYKDKYWRSFNRFPR